MWDGFVWARLLQLSFERRICWLVSLRFVFQFLFVRRQRAQEFWLCPGFEIVTCSIRHVSAMYNMAEVDRQVQPEVWLTRIRLQLYEARKHGSLSRNIREELEAALFFQHSIFTELPAPKTFGCTLFIYHSQPRTAYIRAQLTTS